MPGAERAGVSLEELSHWANAQLQSPGCTERALKVSLQQSDAEKARTICADPRWAAGRTQTEQVCQTWISAK